MIIILDYSPYQKRATQKKKKKKQATCFGCPQNNAKRPQHLPAANALLQVVSADIDHPI